MRTIKIYWRNWRQISRLVRWLGIDCKMDGTFTGKRYQGFKTCHGKYIYFNIKQLNN